MLASLAKLKEWVMARPSQVAKVSQGLGTPGTRAAPAQTGVNDTRIGSRLDNAQTIIKEDGKQYKRYELQINKNADDPTLKKMANKDSHKVWAEALVPIGSDQSKAGEIVEQLFDDLEADIK
ncbi:MAG: hypothetical protein Q9196_007255, partial [Gyalolechia fulgens]